LARKDDEEGTTPDETTLEVELVHARWRNAIWSAIAVGLTAFLVIRAGTFGLVTGVIVLGMGLKSVVAFVKTLLHPAAGLIALREKELVLPRGLCAGDPVTMPIGDLRHAYLLRRKVPFNASAPVLVVETQRGIFEYPRDWFYADQDQRRITIALNRRLGVVE
jgi:hypothetical protein